MDKRLGVFILVLLLVISAVLGYAIYQRVSGKSLSLPTKNQVINPSARPVSTPNASKQSSSSATTSSYDASYLKLLTDDEKKILALDRSSDTIKNNQDLITKTAKTAEFLDVASCQQLPAVFKVTDGADFKIRNSGNSDVKVVIGDFQQAVSAGNTKTFKADFGHSFGIYGASCNDKSSGYLVVTQKQ